jgi:hypothetical protein
MSPQIATNRIINQLVESETNLDTALSSSAALLATMAQARLDVGAEFTTGQVAIMRLVKTLSALSEARADLARTHAEMRKVGETRSDIVFPDECPPTGIVPVGETLERIAA